LDFSSSPDLFLKGQQMKRRAFLSLMGGAAASWPLDARSAAGKRPTVGFLVPGTQAAYAQWIAGFAQRLRELGWVDGDNVAIMYRWTEGAKERYAEIASELVALKVDVIVTSGSEGVIAAKQATSTIPIVFAATSDPVATGLVASLAHPGGAFRRSRPIPPARKSNCYAKSCQVFNGWRSWPIPTIRE
jgi:putative tryptophan/tyrosine transport system substrate-binding protein